MAIVSDVEIRLRADIARLQQDMTAARRSVDTAVGGMADAAQRVRNLFAGIVGGMGLAEVARIADQYAKFTSQLKLATESAREYSQAYGDVRRISNAAQSDLAATGVLYARIANGTRELGVSQQRVGEIVEATSLALKVSGATTEESASAILQLSQAFGAGALRGEEFNAVNEAAPRLMKAIAEGLGVPIGALKNMATEGKLTSQVLADVLPKSLDKLRDEATQVQTIAGAFTLLKNNVMEFVGASAQSSGTVAVLTQSLALLANNLDLVAGAALAFGAAKLVTVLDSWIGRIRDSIAANAAQRAAIIATYEAEAVATATTHLNAQAYLVYAQNSAEAAVSATAMATAAQRTALAEAEATIAANANTVAVERLTVAQRMYSTTTAAANTVIAALGGPLGALITVLGLAATAWSVYQSRQEEANRKAAADTEASTFQIIASIEKQNEKLRERIALAKQAGATDLAKAGGTEAARAAQLLTRINELKEQGNKLDAGSQVELITLQGEYDNLLKVTREQVGLKKELDSTGEATAAIAVRERLTGVNKQYLKDLAALKEEMDKGKIPQAEYIKLVSQLATETWKSSEAGKASEKQIKSTASAAKSAAQEYSDLLDKIHGRAGGQDADFQQNIATLYKGYKAGKQSLSEYVATVEAYIKQQKSSVELEKQHKKALQESYDFQKAYSEGLEATSKWYTDNIKNAQAEAEKNEELARTFGLSKTAIEQLEIARLKEQLAQHAGMGLTLDEIDYLEKLIAAKERSAKALADVDEKERVRDFWTSIDRVAHDTFTSITDGGKGMWQRLRETGKNMFFDWLYQMTLKKWIINIGASMDGSGAVSGIAGAANAIGAGGGIASTLGNLYSAISGGMTLAGGVGSGFIGSLAGGLNGAGAGAPLASALGVQIGNSIAGVVGPEIAGALSSGLGTLAAAAPWVAGAVAVFTLAKKAFGMGPKEFSGNSTLSGTLTSSGVSGNMLADWTKKAGWLRSDQHGVDRLPVDAQLAAGLVSTYKTIQDSTTQYAKALGLNADNIANRSQALNIAFTKDDAANQKAIEAFFTGVADDVAREVLPELAQFQQTGETVAQTMQRLATNAAGVDQILAAMGTTTQQMFGAVGGAAIAARERLLQLVGGLDALASQTTYFYQNFYTDADRALAAQKPLQDALAALGFAGLTTTEQFKDAVDGLVKSGAVATEEGAKQYAGLLALAPQYKMVADYLKGVSDAAAETAKQLADAKAELLAKALGDNEQFLRSMLDNALSAVGRAVEAQKNRVTAAFEATMAALDANISRVNDTISKTGELSKALKGAITAAPGDNGAARYDVARAQISAALAIAKASGVLPTPDSLAAALQTVTQDNADNFETLADYQRAVARTNAELEALGGLTDDQLDTAQLQLELLQAQKDAAQVQHEADLAALDAILAEAQAQVDAINGVNNSVLTVSRAVLALEAAIGTLQAGATPTNPTGTGFTVEDLYRTVLGREGEAAGVAFWKNAFGDVIDQSEYLEFLKGAQPELKGLLQEPPTVATSSGTMSSSNAMLAELQTLNGRMANVETQITSTASATSQFASQFNQVSGGGNSLAVEAI